MSGSEGESRGGSEDNNQGGAGLSPTVCANYFMMCNDDLPLTSLAVGSVVKEKLDAIGKSLVVGIASRRVQTVSTCQSKRNMACELATCLSLRGD